PAQHVPAVPAPVRQMSRLEKQLNESAPHRPTLHVSPLSHARPQAPQLAGSPPKSSVQPPAQHVPIQPASATGHCTPSGCRSQLDGSHTEKTQVEPSGQPMPQSKLEQA